jgi:hypothetical protein
VNGNPEPGVCEDGTPFHDLISARGFDHGDVSPDFVVARTRHQ